MVITQPITHSKTPAKNENHLLRTAAFLPLLRAMEAELLRRRSRMAKSSCASDFRPRVVEFLIVCAHQLQVIPIVKYTALSFFADRFLPYLFRSQKSKKKLNWLLQPIRESSLQLFALVSLWISSKAIDHEIGAKNTIFVFFEDLFHQFQGVSKFGELLNFEACMDIIDLLYEKESWILSCSPCSLAASTLVASYLITVPKQKWEFPILPWVKFVTACDEDEVAQVVTYILEHVFEP
ncbi:Os03g0237900 [Linum perenne]